MVVLSIKKQRRDEWRPARVPFFTAECESHSWQLTWRQGWRRARHPDDDVVSGRIVIARAGLIVFAVRAEAVENIARALGTVAERSSSEEIVALRGVLGRELGECFGILAVVESIRRKGERGIEIS